MKILFVAPRLRRGGAQRVLLQLADSYARAGWEVHVAALLECVNGYSVDDCIRFHDLSRSGSYLKNALPWVNVLRKLVKSEKPDAVVSFVGRINIVSILATRRLHVPLLVSERNDPIHDRRRNVERMLCRLLYPKADRVVFQTQYQRSCYAKRCQRNGVVIGNPVAAEPYFGTHPGRDIICVGKLMDQKNHPMMLRAFAKIHAEFPDVCVRIYGDGERQAMLEQMIAEYGLEDRVQLCGNSSRIFDVMREQPLFVMCSDYEGMSNSLLEAMMSGMVCITTAWNGVQELVCDGVNGYLVPVGDADALAEKLRFALHADNSALTHKAIETASCFAGENVIPKWHETIEAMINGA